MGVINNETLYVKYRRYIALGIYYLIGQFIPDFLPYNIGKNVRQVLCRRIFKKCGSNINIEHRVFIGLGKDIEIGSNTGIGWHTYIGGIGGGGRLIIGDNVMIAPETVILTLAHKFENLRSVKGKYNSTTIQIGDHSWIGMRSILLPGVNIGAYTIIGAGSVVTKEIPSYVVAAGSPASVRKKRLTFVNKTE